MGDNSPSWHKQGAWGPQGIFRRVGVRTHAHEEHAGETNLLRSFRCVKGVPGGKMSSFLIYTDKEAT